MKFLKFLLLFIFLSFNTFSKNQENLEIFSEKADFNGKDLSLKGVIKLKHPLGNLEAKKAFFDNKKESIILEDNVKLTIPQKGFLKSSHAIYNTKSKKLNFDSPVFYKSLIHQKTKDIPLIITSKKAECIKNLESQGYQVVTARDGLEGLATLKAENRRSNLLFRIRIDS